MKNLYFLLLLLLLGCGTNQNATKKVVEVVDPIPYANTITEEELKTHLYIYASDEFEGRNTGDEGQKKAVAYLKNEYEKFKITAAKKNGDYYQKVPLQKGSQLYSELTIDGKAFAYADDFLSFAPAKNGTFNVKEVVYIGYGIDDPKHSDYTIDVKDKIVLAKMGEPVLEDGSYLISGTMEASKWSKRTRQEIAAKTIAAKEHGAKGLLLYTGDVYPRLKLQFDFIKRNSRMGLKNDNNTFFSYYLNDVVAEALLANISNDETPKTISKDITIVNKDKTKDVDSENVVAFIEGSEKPNEYVIISAHLDHVGVKDGEVYNGADDDGSGTVAVLEIAEAFMKAKEDGNGPKRSIVFLHVTGEEKGLLGSSYYTQDPIFPLSQTVTNLNIDMIGRIDPKREGDRNYIYLIGSDKLSQELHDVSEQINNKYTNIELDYKYNDDNDPNRFYYRSDHYNFAKHNIPIIFYFNGTHADYHKASDTVDKINFDLLTNRTKLVFYTAWEVANREKRIVADKLLSK